MQYNHDQTAKPASNLPNTSSESGTRKMVDALLAAAVFTGHPYDTVLDIYFAEARFYDAKHRQWMVSDPIKNGLNWYLYVEGNPATYWDPTGLEYYDKNGAIIPVQLDDLARYVGNTQVYMIMEPQGVLYGDLAEMVAGI